jgi:hypothetical protein
MRRERRAFRRSPVRYQVELLRTGVAFAWHYRVIQTETNELLLLYTITLIDGKSLAWTQDTQDQNELSGPKKLAL